MLLLNINVKTRGGGGEESGVIVCYFGNLYTATMITYEGLSQRELVQYVT